MAIYSKRHLVEEYAKQVHSEVGNVSILINNAAIVTGKTILDATDESIHRTFEVNLFSQFWVSSTSSQWFLQQASNNACLYCARRCSLQEPIRNTLTNTCYLFSCFTVSCLKLELNLHVHVVCIYSYSTMKFYLKKLST